ncbi:hypothetical protein M427DRAFT_51270 [Gonapodya prolifera JEL478]|uniref:Nudix hydrolase domain-containing protein n=1 Tax=Gonapodya prolifera (strain JEL478) TaxID=1344416 RepID=A0A139AYV8_GONPJ|nr:hypothetical protein M427DRAFT_51270 [Gonapodya prolifera JEL478]|eukprot:KXS21909.1 hypothetical protein M427DRAFT_51270 [Gonapodya prolifera JEL478]
MSTLGASPPQKLDVLPSLSLLLIVQACNNYVPSPDEVPFFVASHRVGTCTPDVAKAIADYSSSLPNSLSSPAPFIIEHHPAPGAIRLAPHLDSVQARSDALHAMVLHWRGQRSFPCLAGWREERYPVYAPRRTKLEVSASPHSHSDSEPKQYPLNLLLTVERSAAGLFGLRTYGAHLNGVVIDRAASSTSTSPRDTHKMWIATRSLSKPTWPGWLDNMVAGGIPWDSTPYETIVRECGEEGDIPEDLARTATTTSAITYTTHTQLGICPETQYIYDLILPASFVPRPRDGEVESFRLVGVDELMSLVRGGRFKPNCAVVVVDWLVRVGVVTPESEPDYLDVLSALRQPLPFPGPDYTDWGART